MLFKTPTIARQWPSIHPVVRGILKDAEAVAIGWGLSELALTEAVRSRAENTGIYTAIYQADGLSATAAANKAAERFSWHMCSCAIDFRGGSGGYRQEDNQRLLAWLRGRYTKPLYEVLFHDAGTGAHFHVAHLDFYWRKKWEDAQRPGLA